MAIIEELTEKEYCNFFNNSNYNHFLQSYEWGQVAAERKQTPLYLGLKNKNGTILAACLALKKHVPIINKNYYYSPRGILIDYDNESLLKEYVINNLFDLENNYNNFKSMPYIPYRIIEYCLLITNYESF